MNKKTEIDRTIEEIREMRLRYDLTHIIFAFPRVKSELDEDWKDPAGFVTGCIAAANKSQHPRDKNLPLSVKGIEQIEFDVTIPNVKRLMNFGVFTITRNKRGFRIALPLTLTRVCKGISGRRMGDDLQVRLGLWPGFGQQPDAAPEPALEEQPPEPVDAVPDYAYGAARPGARGCDV